MVERFITEYNKYGYRLNFCIHMIKYKYRYLLNDNFVYSIYILYTTLIFLCLCICTNWSLNSNGFWLTNLEYNKYRICGFSFVGNC